MRSVVSRRWLTALVAVVAVLCLAPGWALAASQNSNASSQSSNGNGNGSANSSNNSGNSAAQGNGNGNGNGNGHGNGGNDHQDRDAPGDRHDDGHHGLGDGPGPLPSLSVLAEVKVGRHPEGVALDGHGHAVVANRNSQDVSLVDLATGVELWSLSVGRQPQAVAVNPDTQIAAVTLTDENKVALVDLVHRTVLAKVAVGRHPAGVAIDPALNRAFVVNRDSQTLSVIDLGTAQRTANLSVGRRPVAVAVNPVTHVVAVATFYDAIVRLLDFSNPAAPVTAETITLPGARPSANHDRGENDDDDGPRGHAHPIALAFDFGPGLNRLVVADRGQYGVHVLTLDAQSHFTTAQFLRLGERPTAVAVNPTVDFALVTGYRNDVYGFTLTEPAFVDATEVGKHPAGLAVDPLGCRAVVTNRDGRLDGRNEHGDRKPGTVSVLGNLPCGPHLRSVDPASVTLGTITTMTLHGTGFNFDSLVTFDSSTGLVPLSLTATTIVARVTALSPGPLPISVTSNQITSNALPVTVVIPPPTLTAVSPATVLANTATTLTLTGTNFLPGSTVNFGTTTGIVPISVAPQSITVQVTPPSTAGPVPISVTSNAQTTASLNVQVVLPAPPVLTAISPTSAEVGTALTLTLTGTGFAPGTTVNFGAATGLVPLTFSTTSLTVAVTVPGTAGPVAVSVSSNSQTSNVVVFQATPPPPPPLSVTAVSPPSVQAASVFTLTLTGTGFQPGSTVNFGSQVLTPTSITSTSISAQATAPSTTGPVSVSVTSGAVVSNALTVQVTAAPPPLALTSLVPASADVNTTLTLTLIGTGFAPGATVNFGTQVLTPTIVTSGQMTVSVTTPSTTGSVPVSVTQGAETTASINFSVTQPPPTITSISPTSVPISTTFTLTLHGTNFLTGSTVTVGGTTGIVPTSITSTTIVATVTAPSTPGLASVSVTSGSQTSNTVQIQFTRTPQITTLAPATSVADGNALTLTVNGQNFSTGAQVWFNGQAVPTTFVSATQVKASLTGFPGQGLTLYGGLFDVQVINADGVPSNVVKMTLKNPTPVLSLVLPNNVTQGGGDATVLLNGDGFVSRFDTSGALVAVTEVLFNGQQLAQSAVVPVTPSPTQQLRITIPAAYLQTPGVFQIHAYNPPALADGSDGGASLNQPFTVNTNSLPQSVSVNTFGLPDGDAVQVDIFGRSTQVIAAVTVPAAGELQLLDVTDPSQDPLLLGAVAITASSSDYVADVGADEGVKRLVASIVTQNAVAIVDDTDAQNPVHLGDVAVGGYPSAIAMDTTRHQALVINSGTGDPADDPTVANATLSVVDVDPASPTYQTEIARIPLGLDYTINNPVAVAVNPVTHIAGVVVQTTTADGSTSLNGSLLFVDLNQAAVTTTVATGLDPSAIAINPNTNEAIVANQSDNTIAIVDLANQQVKALLPVGQAPASIAFDAQTNKALITNFMNNQVWALNAATDQMSIFQLGQTGDGAAVAPLDIAWMPGTTQGVVVMTKLLPDTTSLIILGLPTNLLP